jgi:hypothetical protein
MPQRLERIRGRTCCPNRQSEIAALFQRMKPRVVVLPVMIENPIARCRTVEEPGETSWASACRWAMVGEGARPGLEPWTTWSRVWKERAETRMDLVLRLGSVGCTRTTSLRATSPKAYVCRNADAADPLVCGPHEFTGVLRHRSSSGHECSSTGARVSLGR